MSDATCSLTIRVFDGSRQLLPADAKVLYTVRDGSFNYVYRAIQRGPELSLRLPFYNNLRDLYTVIAFADGYKQAGLAPIKVSPASPQTVSLMLLGADASFNFNRALWENLPATRPALVRLLSAGAASDDAARDRYGDLLENRSASLACFLNITTAMAQIQLADGSPLDYLQQLIWDNTMAQDRFFGYADVRLIDEVRQAVPKLFAPETGSSIFHPGATSSFKQIQFSEANVQLTFHEGDKQTIGGVACVKVEPDIDYYRDLGSHAILEVAPNALGGSLTNPREVYVLRWMAGLRAGLPEFDPLYTIV